MSMKAPVATAFQRMRAAFQHFFTPRLTGRAGILIRMQLALMALLTAILILTLIVNQGDRRFSYVLLISSLLVILLAAMYLNRTGRYNASAWITMILMSAAPWAALIFDPRILAGDVIPLIYIVLSIHLCATFLNEWATSAIAVVQLIAIAILLFVNPSFADVNRVSFLAYIVSAAVIGITTSSITRKHIEQIEAQNSALRESEEQLWILSTRDPLTGQYNRRYMEETLAREIDRVIRKKLPLGLMILDLDDFKSINDAQGHMVGDAVLRHIAQILEKITRPSDVVCRFGGDEFVLIFPECEKTVVEVRREEITKRITESSCQYDGCRIETISVSFGIASLPEDGVTAAALLKAADTALYASKRLKRSKNCSA
jgi:diguanylate cyclase (GGDEF)-like protein